MDLLIWGLVGYCPDWWPRKWPPGPPPWKLWAIKVLGFVGGIIGGTLVRSTLGQGEPIFVATAIGALAVGGALASSGALLLGGGAQR